MTYSTFCISFGSDGFEGMADLTALRSQDILDKLTGDKTIVDSVNRTISMMKWSARCNSQRKVEVWLLDVEDDLIESDLRKWQDDDPQGAADFIRDNGTCLFGASHGLSKAPIIR
jgi:hypothetical protein